MSDEDNQKRRTLIKEHIQSDNHRRYTLGFLNEEISSKNQQKLIQKRHDTQTVHSFINRLSYFAQATHLYKAFTLQFLEKDTYQLAFVKKDRFSMFANRFGENANLFYPNFLTDFGSLNLTLFAKPDFETFIHKNELNFSFGATFPLNTFSTSRFFDFSIFQRKTFDTKLKNTKKNLFGFELSSDFGSLSFYKKKLTENNFSTDVLRLHSNKKLPLGLNIDAKAFLDQNSRPQLKVEAFCSHFLNIANQKAHFFVSNYYNIGYCSRGSMHFEKHKPSFSFQQESQNYSSILSNLVTIGSRNRIGNVPYEIFCFYNISGGDKLDRSGFSSSYGIGSQMALQNGCALWLLSNFSGDLNQKKLIVKFDYH